MNIIHSTFKDLSTVYTVIGDIPAGGDRDLPALIVLNRGGGPFRQEYFDSLKSLPFSEILSVEIAKGHTDMKELASLYSRLRFLNVSQEISIGEALNIAFLEIRAPFALVLWNDFIINTNLLSKKLFENLSHQDELCLVPQLFSFREEPIPSFVAPVHYQKQFKTIFLAPGGKDFPSLFPFDFSGFYSKTHFLELGGFDARIHKTYWQKLDFGFRAHMWGKKIQWGKGLRFSYREETYSEDTTYDDEYKLFYLKNLALIFQDDHGLLPLTHLIPFLLGTKGHVYRNLKLFFNTRKWVDLHKFRYVRDARSVTELWGVSDE